MKIRNTYLEKQIRTKYVPNGVFREANTYLVRTSVNARAPTSPRSIGFCAIWESISSSSSSIRTKYVPNTCCVFPYSLRIYVLKLVKYALLIFLWATDDTPITTVGPPCGRSFCRSTRAPTRSRAGTSQDTTGQSPLGLASPAARRRTLELRLCPRIPPDSP